MSGSGAGGGAPGGVATGGGFTQSPNPFSGLTNTDLRPSRRRKRRRVALLDTSWIRNKGSAMHKTDISGLVDLLDKSVTEIANSQAEDRDERLSQSIGEFEAALLAKIEPFMPSLPDEPLAKGINHIALFAGALRDLTRTVDAIKTGKPSYMVDNGLPPEEISEEIEMELDRFVQVGMTTLRDMVTGSVINVLDEDDVVKAEAAGELHKIDMLNGPDLLVKGALPEDLAAWLTDPVVLMLEKAELGRSFTANASELAEVLDENGLITEAMVEEYPEVFGVEEGLHKAGPTGDDETVGDGTGNPDGGQDPGDDQNDLASMDPLETVVKLLSAALTIMAPMVESGAGEEEDDGEDQGDPSGMPDDQQMHPSQQTPRMPPQRPRMNKAEQINDALASRGVVGFDAVTLNDILSGKVEVDPTLGDALEKALTLEKTNAELQKRTGADQEALQKLQATVVRMQSDMEKLGREPAAPKGVVFSVNKSDDSAGMTPQQGDEVERISKMAASNPEGAAKELLKKVHQGGGRPIIASD